MTQRITARKVECGNVGKIVARGEIEKIKKEFERSFARPFAVGKGERGKCTLYGFSLLSAHSLTVNFVQKSGWVFTDLAALLKRRQVINSFFPSFSLHF